ncbi:mRNA (guanine-N7-)-methyltransferase, partial [Phenoliferia sp. Uapishka_3]
MHYAFESEEKVRMMLDNVSRFLRPGGVFIGTIPDATNLLDRLGAIPEGEELEFGNSVYKVKFDSRDSTPRYGHRYTFFLEDAVEEVPEYVVYWEEFAQIATEYGLTLSFCADFQQIFAEERQDPYFSNLLTRMKVVDEQGETEMNLDQWEAANLYLGFAFTKEEAGGEEEAESESEEEKGDEDAGESSDDE